MKNKHEQKFKEHHAIRQDQSMYNYSARVAFWTNSGRTCWQTLRADRCVDASVDQHEGNTSARCEVHLAEALNATPHIGEEP